MKIFQLKYKNLYYDVICDNEDYNSWGNLIPRLIKQRKNLRVVLTKNRKKGTRINIYFHRFIMKLNDSKKQIDHIDNNPLNNCKNNLRICDNSINNQNKPKQCNNKSGYKGVVFRHKTQKYTAQIGYNKKQIYLGSFNTAEEAAKSYNIAAKKYFGDLAGVNFK